MKKADVNGENEIPLFAFLKSQKGFEGFGRGHGVGLSQYGAESYAKSGWKYDQILKHYYKDTELKKLY